MKTLLYIIFILQFNTVYAKNNHWETHYQKIHCNDIQGRTEVRIKYGRIDCETEKYAIEHDFAKKAFECIGQALYYAEVTNKIPVCALIFEHGASDVKATAIFNKATTHIPNIYLVKIFQDNNGIKCKIDNSKANNSKIHNKDLCKIIHLK